MRNRLFLLLLLLFILPVARAVHIPVEEENERAYVAREQNDRLAPQLMSQEFLAQQIPMQEEKRRATEPEEEGEAGVPGKLSALVENTIPDIVSRARFDIGDQATLTVPADWKVMTQPAAARFLHTALGIDSNERQQGVLFFGPFGDDSAASYRAFAQILYQPIGHLDEAGFSRLDITGLEKQINEPMNQYDFSALNDLQSEWIVKPTYDTATHQLIWGMKTTLKEYQRDQKTVTHFYAGIAILGREGVVRIISDTGNTDPEQMKSLMQALSEAGKRLQFHPGHRYTDYRSGDMVATDDPESLIAPPLLPPAESSPNAWSEGSLLLCILFFVGLCYTIFLIEKMIAKLKAGGSQNAALTHRTPVWLGLCAAMCNIVAMLYLIVLCIPMVLMGFIAMIGAAVGIVVVCVILSSLAKKLAHTSANSDRQAARVTHNIHVATFAIGIVSFIGVFVVSWSTFNANQAQMRHLHQDLMSYPITRITLDFSNVKDRDRTQVLHQTLAKLSPIVLAFNKTITVSGTTRRGTSWAQRDTMPSYYHWDGNRLVIALSRVLLPVSVQKIDRVFHPAPGTPASGSVHVTVEPITGFSPWYVSGTYTEIVDASPVRL